MMLAARPGSQQLAQSLLQTYLGRNHDPLLRQQEAQHIAPARFGQAGKHGQRQTGKRRGQAGDDRGHDQRRDNAGQR